MSNNYFVYKTSCFVSRALYHKSGYLGKAVKFFEIEGLINGTNAKWCN